MSMEKGKSGDSYLCRGDDGQLYRISKEQLKAFKLAPGDPANQESETLAKMHEAAKKVTQPIHTDAVCFIAMKERGK